MNALPKCKWFLLCYLLMVIDLYGQSSHMVALETTRIILTKENKHIEINFTIQDGFHIQSFNVKDTNLIQSELNITAPKELLLESPAFPKTHSFVLQGSNDTIQVYSDQLKILIPIKKNELVLGSYSIEGNLYYQACSNIKCYFPRTLLFSIEVVNQ